MIAKEPGKRRKVLRSIQCLRAVAALLVVFFHMELPGSAIGAAGVDLFFVISGFIMGTIAVHETTATFVARRIARIVPTYWLVTLALCVASSLGLVHYLHFTTSELAASLMFVPYTDVSGHAWPVLIVGWTLNLEMAFYAVFAVGLMLRRPVIFTAAILIALALIGSLYQPAKAPLSVWTSPLLIEFVFGLAVASTFHIAAPKLGTAMIAGGAVALTLAAILHTGENIRVVAWGIPALLLVLGALAIERSGKLPKLTLLEKIGDASFSLYLTHDVVIGFVHKAVGTGFLSVPLIIVAALALARVMYLYVEKPALRFFRSRSLSKPMDAVGVVASGGVSTSDKSL